MISFDDKQIQGTPRGTGRRLTITADPVFKFVFGSPDSAHILQSLLNALLGPYVDTPFGRLPILNGEYPSPDPAMRSCLMDIVATDAFGRIINVEVQRYDDKYCERLTPMSPVSLPTTPLGGRSPPYSAW